MTPLSALPTLFFFNDTATTEIYTLSLHDALPIFIASPLLVPAASPLAQIATAVYLWSPAWCILGVIILYWRYRRSQPRQRRPGRQALVRFACALLVFVALFCLGWTGRALAAACPVPP